VRNNNHKIDIGEAIKLVIDRVLKEEYGEGVRYAFEIKLRFEESNLDFEASLAVLKLIYEANKGI